VERVASEHGVSAARLRWWRWRLSTELGAAPEAAGLRMLEVIARTETVASAPAREGVRVIVGEVVLELGAGLAPEYVGRVVAAIRQAC